MSLDRATLADLHVLSGSEGAGLALIDVLDRTRSQVGRERLKERIQSPLSRSEEILSLQTAHQAISENIEGFGRLLDTASLDQVQRYLNSTWQLPLDGASFRGFFERLSVRFRYSAYLDDVTRGKRSVLSLLESALSLTQARTTQPSEVLEQLRSTVKNSLESEIIACLASSKDSTSVVSLLAFDRTARGRAREQLSQLLAVFGELEALWSVAATTDARGWVYPELGPGLEIDDLVHPFLEEKGIASSIALGPEVRVCFITGPNMAGKSTLLRSVAVAQLLAQIGSGVPARQMRFRPLGTIFSSLNATDNLHAGESLFLAEVRRIRGLASTIAGTGSVLGVLDEPFRGTNTDDANAATAALIGALASIPYSIVLIASHCTDLAGDFSSDDRIRLLHLSGTDGAGEMAFDYQVHRGVSRDRLGLRILQDEGVMDLFRVLGERGQGKP